jgi:hypothetical protein
MSSNYLFLHNSVRKSLYFILSIILLCCVFSCKESIKSEDENKEINFTEHISPIVYKNCSPCHRPGQAGPFSLLTYNDVRRNANKIKFAVSTRYMPPWPADPSYSHFLGERVLSEHEITLIKKWIDNKMPSGDTARLVVPEFNECSYFGKPDLVVKMQSPVELKGNGEDNFLVVKLPYEIEKDTFVRLIEFVPGKRKLIHHVNGHTISYDSDKKKNVFSGKNILPDMLDNFNVAFTEMGLQHDDGSFPVLTPGTVYYLPGYTPPKYPDNVGGYFLKRKGAFLLKNIHYGPTAQDVYDSSYINVFYRKNPPERIVREIQLGTFGLSEIEPEFTIPANEVKTFHTHWIVPNEISLLSVNPHMHLLGKNFVSYAVTPGKDTIPIIRINKWDFRWQYYYTFKKVLRIPKGSVIHAFATFDNTKNNLLNPYSPPKTFHERKGKESMKTTEEMFQLILSILPYKAGDEKMSLEP